MGASSKTLIQVALEATPGTSLAAKRILPGEGTFELKQKYDEPKEHRGTYDETVGQILQPLTRLVDFNVKGEWYPETCNGLLYLTTTNNPNVVSTGASSPNPAYNTYTFAPGDTLKTATFEEFDSQDAYNYAYGFATKLELDFTAESALMYTLAGMAQDRVHMGSGITTLTQPTDSALVGTKAQAYFDNTAGGIGGSANTQVVSGKWSLDLATKSFYTAANTATYKTFYRGKRKVEFEMELEFSDLLEYNHFVASDYRFIQHTISGQPLAAGANKNCQMQIMAAGRYLSWVLDKSKEAVTVKVKGKVYLDATLNYSHQVVTQIVSASTTY